MKRLARPMFLAVALVALGAFQAQAILITVDPSTTTVQMGDTFSVDLVISGLGPGDLVSVATGPSGAISAFDLDITFDPAVAEFASAAFGDPLQGNQLEPRFFSFASFGVATPTVGSVNLYDVSFSSGWELEVFQLDSFILATLDFTGSSLGVSVLDLTVNDLGDALGNPLSADLQGAAVEVVFAPVPEPGTLILLGSGLVGLAGWGRRRRTM